MEEADVILVRSANMHEMAVPANLKAVARAGAGVNNIPLESLAEAGVAVFNTPGANANAVKELVIAGMLLASRDIIGGVEWCRANADDENIGKSAEKAKKQFAGTEITGKTLGVIGLGAIGKLVAQAVEALGMKVVGYDPYSSAEKAAAISPNLVYVESLDDLYPVADFVTIHVPATPDTKGMVNADAFAQMKDDVVLLNFARDTLVDDAALAEAMEAGKVRAYVTDFANPAVMQLPRAIGDSAPGRFHRRSRRQLRHHGCTGGNGLPSQRRENPLREHVKALGNPDRSSTRGGLKDRPAL